MWKQCFAIICTLLTCSIHPALAQSSAAPPYDEALAKSLGVNESGLRPYVLVILKTGPNKVPEGEARTKMFQGHFANMQRLAEEKKLVLAGPLDGIDGWRGVFVFATPDVEQAKAYVATDPVIINGEMVAEYHKLFSSGGALLHKSCCNQG